MSNYHKMDTRDRLFKVPRSQARSVRAVAAGSAGDGGADRGPSDRIAARQERRRRQEESARHRREELVMGGDRIRTQMKDDTAHWTNVEQQRLLKELRKYGSKKTRKLARGMQTRSEDCVRAYVQKLKLRHNFYSTLAQPDSGEIKAESHALLGGGSDALASDGEPKLVRVRRERDTPIERWIGMAEAGKDALADLSGGASPAAAPGAAGGGDHARGIPVLMECIAKGEEHPPGPVDFGAMYETLGCLMSGEAPPELNPETSDKMAEMMGRLLDCVEENREFLSGERSTFELFKLNTQRAAEEMMARAEEEASQQGPEDRQRGSLAMLNVLGLPERLMNRKM